MKNMYEISPRGNEYIYGKILLDNFNVCHSCRQFYPIDRCPDAVLADPKLLSKKSVNDFGSARTASGQIGRAHV